MKMIEANKEVFYKVGLWLWYVMAPAAIIYFATGELLFNAFALWPSLWLTCFAGILWAFIDSVDNTRFRDLEQSFWYKRESWNKAKKIFKYKFDAWHLGKSAIIFCFVGAVVLYRPMTGSKLFDFCLLGYFYNLFFNGFYNQIFSKK
jgi:hypothetical protein